MPLRDGLPLAAAAVTAPAAGTLWWMLVDQISLGQALGSPFPYLLLAIAWFVATPIYLALDTWLDGKLWRLLLVATIGASPFALKAIQYFLTPRDIFVTALIVSTAWVCAGVYWMVVRLAGLILSRQSSSADCR